MDKEGSVVDINHFRNALKYSLSNNIRLFDDNKYFGNKKLWCYDFKEPTRTH